MAATGENLFPKSMGEVLEKIAGQVPRLQDPMASALLRSHGILRRRAPENQEVLTSCLSLLDTKDPVFRHLSPLDHILSFGNTTAQGPPRLLTSQRANIFIHSLKLNFPIFHYQIPSWCHLPHAGMPRSFTAPEINIRCL